MKELIIKKHKEHLEEIKQKAQARYSDKAWPMLNWLEAKMMAKIEMLDPECYEEIVEEMEAIAYGYHFTENSSKKAVSRMLNIDGTKGEHWNIASTNGIYNSLPKSHTQIFNEYDFYYAINMMYSDHSKSIEKLAMSTGMSSSTQIYIDLAIEYLTDRDYPEKAFKCYMAKKSHEEK